MKASKQDEGAGRRQFRQPPHEALDTSIVPASEPICSLIPQGESGTVLGLDPSLAATGWALVSNADQLLHSGTISPPDDSAPYRDRARWIAEQIVVLVRRLEPSLIAIETPWLGKNPQTLEELSFLSGAISASLGSRTPISFMPPGVWRGRGLGLVNRKEAVLAYLDQILRQQGFDPDAMGPDAVEAFGISLAAHRLARPAAVRNTKETARCPR